MTVSLTEIKNNLTVLANKKQAIVLQRFFKTAKGQYGYGDIFLGITVPQSRQVAKKFSLLALDDIEKLLQSKIHEQRLVALLILIEQFKRADKIRQKKIYNLYLKNYKFINNWDLVDLSAPSIVGTYLLDKSRARLYQLARAKNLWQRRVAIISTFSFIRNNEFKDTLELARILLNDSHDLIHKASGWMLREVGKRDLQAVEKFLDQNAKIMPRTMLRYAIEKFEPKKRRFYLQIK